MKQNDNNKNSFSSEYKWKYKVKKLDANSLKIVDNKYNKAEL